MNINSCYGANLLNVVKESVKQAKERFDTEVYAVVSDHASSMENMGAAVKSLGLLYSHQSAMRTREIRWLATC